jgi:hypothetical protein
MNNFQENCKQAVFQTIDFPMSFYCGSKERDEAIDDTYESLNVVWFSKTLQNHKALVMSTADRFDHIYWEVTYNGDKKEYYVDEYSKVSNSVLQLEDVVNETM